MEAARPMNPRNPQSGFDVLSAVENHPEGDLPPPERIV
jgi:hypothetical protein